MSCLSIAERGIHEVQSWSEDPKYACAWRMWTTASFISSCCVTLIFASILRKGNSLLYDPQKMRHLAHTGRDSLRKIESINIIALRAGRLLDILVQMDDHSLQSGNVYFDMEDIVSRVAKEGEKNTQYPLGML